jgi:uncharacterized damage-inducible protein DinB
MAVHVSLLFGDMLSHLYTEGNMALGKQTLLTQVEYSEWATRRLLQACAGLASENINRECGVSHGSVAGTLHHIFRGERFWTTCLRTRCLPPIATIGESPRPANPPPEPDLQELENWWAPVWKDLHGWLDNAPEAEIESELTSCRASGEEFRVPAWKLLLHMLTHSTLHRGQIVFMLRSMGHASPEIDFFDYLQH